MFKGNKIYIIDKNGNKKRVFWVKGLKVKFKGKNSTVLIQEPISRFKKCHFECGNNSFIKICNTKYTLNRLHILANTDNSHCEIGKDFSCTNKCTILLHKEPSLSVTIGNDCMFGTNVVLRTTDAHAIYSLEDKKVNNFGQSISIGDHCWVAMNVTLLKGVHIANNSIIGTGSLVTKSCEKSNSIYAGVPAKLIKSDVNWDRKTPCEFKNSTIG